MADVYKVYDQKRATYLAMKVLHENLAEDKVFLRRFKREAHNLAKLKHPHIVHVDDFRQSSGCAWLRMELVEGGSLAEVMKAADGPLPESEVRTILEQILTGLSYAHEQGVVHRDLKPSNVLVTVKDSRPVVKIIDFGIAQAFFRRYA